MEKFTCAVCRLEYDISEAHSGYIDICTSCAVGGRKANLVVTKTNEDWQKIAEQNSIEIYLRQPGETDTEWRIWQAYCAMYPQVKPNLRVAAEIADVSYGTARLASSKWEYVVRVQAYKLFVDDQLASLRRDNVVAMANRHVALAAKLQEKLELAVDKINPEYLKPSEINSLLKTMTDLENKVYLDKDIQEVKEWKPNVNGNAGQKAVSTKKSDLSEILSILGTAGVLNKVGIETTTTTRVVGELEAD